MKRINKKLQKLVNFMLMRPLSPMVVKWDKKLEKESV